MAVRWFDVKEPGNLLHNMSVPSRSVISFSGVERSASKKIWQVASKEPQIIAFRVNSKDKKCAPLDILTDIGVTVTSSPESTLKKLIDERANELPLPDGCAVIEYRPDHVQKWQDELAQLAVVCKSSSSVWLRFKEPRLSLIDERRSVSLFLPFGFKG